MIKGTSRRAEDQRQELGEEDAESHQPVWGRQLSACLGQQDDPCSLFFRNLLHFTSLLSSSIYVGPTA